MVVTGVSQLGVDLGDIDMPRCLSRCGIAPDGVSLSVEQIMVLQLYLVMCNNHAAHSYHNYKIGLELPAAVVDLTPFGEGHLRLKRLSIKPLSKKEGLLPSLPLCPSGFRVDVPEVHFDGSFTPACDGSDDKAGYGVAVAVPPPPLPTTPPGPVASTYVPPVLRDSNGQVVVTDAAGNDCIQCPHLCAWDNCPICWCSEHNAFNNTCRLCHQKRIALHDSSSSSEAPPLGVSTFCGPVTTRPNDNHYLGATQLTNNSAELAGGIVALQAALALVPAGPVVIGYDSEYARQVITGGWRPRRNARLAAKARCLLQQLSSTHGVTWRHVDSHTGDYLNELADSLASLGSDGTIRPLPGRPLHH